MSPTMAIENNPIIATPYFLFTAACRSAPWKDALILGGPCLSATSWPAPHGLRPSILMWPGGASMVLATFAETKVARLPGRNPAMLVIVGKYLEGIKYQNQKNNCGLNACYRSTKIGTLHHALLDCTALELEGRVLAFLSVRQERSSLGVIFRH